jgi:hypothetical protein
MRRTNKGWVEINGGNKTGMMLMRTAPRALWPGHATYVLTRPRTKMEIKLAGKKCVYVCGTERERDDRGSMV